MRMVKVQGGVDLPEDEWLECITYFSGCPAAKVQQAWQRGDRLGSLVLGTACLNDVYDRE